MNKPKNPISPRERVNKALDLQTPDRTPVDFLAVPEIWDRLIKNDEFQKVDVEESAFYKSEWEGILRSLQVDCRVISYDQFCNPPGDVLQFGAKVDWYSSLGRSTPNRMWRQITPGNDILDIFGRHFRIVENNFGAYEELTSYPLKNAESTSDLKEYPWPDPDWWDFSGVPGLLDQLDAEQKYHLRYRIGSVFEVAWQLRGMDSFLMDLAINPDMAFYIMERLTDTYVEITDRFLSTAGDRVDMVYFYDDVATQESLLVSKDMWERFIKPHHTRLVEVSRKHNQRIMYHCDGAIHSLIPDLIDMGINVLNPIQADAKEMAPSNLKKEFGDRLAFHGGIDITNTLPNGTPEEVRAEVQTRINELGTGGGYVMASSHHIQADTPVENIKAMYDISLR